MKEGDVILTPIPQADGTVKNRPALLLREMPYFRDFLVCGISTQLHRRVVGFDEAVSPEDDDFASSGLISASLIRLGFLAVLPRKTIAGSIGSISNERLNRLRNRLSIYLSEPHTA
jgi:mRNA interferase MazF